MKPWCILRAAATVLLVLAVISSAGCWSRREIQEIGFALLIGLDHAAEEGKVMITVHIAKPFSLLAAGAGTAEEKAYWQVSSTGRTVFDAWRNLRQQSPRRPLLHHSRFIVFGEEFARSGIREALDFFYREGEVRETNFVVVAKGAKASEFVWGEYELEPMPSRGALGVIKQVAQELSTIVMVTLNDFLQMMEAEGIEAVASRAEQVWRPPSQDPRGQLKNEVIAVSGRETGAAAFKGDKLAGWLDKVQARGLQWVRGKVRSGILVIEQPGKENKLASIEILRATSTVTPKISEGRPSIQIKVDAVGVIGEVQEYLDPMASEEIWASMERRMAEAIRHEIEAALDIAKHEFNSDIFGFGAAFARRYPKEWDGLKRKWDEEFPKLDVEIEVKTIIRRSGLTRRSMQLVRRKEEV